MTDWPGDTTPLPHQPREDRLGARLAGMVGKRWRCDSLLTPRSEMVTRWFDTEAEAVAEETRLSLGGCSRVVAWRDDSMEETR